MVYSPAKNILSWAADLDQATIEQALKAANLPFLKGPLRLMGDAHLGYGVPVGTVLLTLKAILPAAVGVDIGCFVGETKVPLLDGTQMTLKEMTETGKEYWVYSFDPVSQSVKPGKARALKTRSDAKLLSVIVSGGAEVICTPDHEFMLKDGTYKRADELKFNESLKPLYRRWQSRDSYEPVSTGAGDQRLTHKLVFDAMKEEGLGEEMVIHHKNHIHFDNRPDNLTAMTASDHSSHHRKTGHAFDNNDVEFQKARKAGIRRRANDPVKRQKLVDVGTENITKHMTENKEEWLESVAGNGKRGAKYLTQYNTTPLPCDECGEMQANPASLRWHRAKEHESETNHKVIAVKTLDSTADVYCLQVEEYHNFALAAGVFVHNCGMIAQRTTMDVSGINLDALHDAITRVVPSGQPNRRNGTSGSFMSMDRPVALTTYQEALLGNVGVMAPGYSAERADAQFGTLGGGNHFVEVMEADDGAAWVVLHSGSRGVGKAIADIHIGKAKDLMKQWFIDVDPNLSYLVEGTPEFDAYITAMLWAQDYAKESRNLMMAAVMSELNGQFDMNVADGTPINAHHNYTVKENDVWVTRKGAIDAHEGVMGIIPGSMATGSYIVKGLGNSGSANSASHGAGRKMSRSAAKKKFAPESLDKAMEGIVWNDDAKGLIDEHPGAYKDIDDVMEAQKDLVQVEERLRTVLNYKGG